MGGVRIEPFNVQITSSLANAFTLWEDDFGLTPGRTISPIIRDYLHIVPSNNGVVGACTDVPSVGPGNGILFSQNSAANPQNAIWIPKFVVGANNRSQFSQATIVSDSGSSRGGLSVLGWGDHRAVGSSAVYTLVFARDSGNMVLQRTINGGVATSLLTVAIPAVGSVVVVTADLEASPGNVSFELFDDGLSVGTFLDNAVPNVLGLPGFFTRNIVPAGQSFQLGEFRCGILSRL